LGNKTYTVSPFVYWDSNGALVLDYAVSPDISAGVPSWWEQNYGDRPDLTLNLPWRYDEEKGIGSTNPQLQREETRDIIFDPLLPEPGETVTISARIQNYSLLDNFTPVSVKFYLDDPRNGGTLLEDKNGNSEFELPSINARNNQVINLEGWVMPEGLSRDSKVYVVIDEENEVQEIHENNNTGWALVNPNLGIATSNEDFISEVPEKHTLYQNYPNPFNPGTNIRFELNSPADVRLEVFDVIGRRVAVLVDSRMTSGSHEVRFDASALSSGIYFYRLQTSDAILSRKMLLLK
ncbi:MAG TPA: T9SS type A sorting domain-containing protein, partial [Balneolaceae bacterium]|nr:T9SS type A sorting domain-containing protein [Balneolaceae bacterium]